MKLKGSWEILVVFVAVVMLILAIYLAGIGILEVAREVEV